MVDSMSDGSISTRTVDGALELFERMATTSAMWSSERAIPRKTPGVYEVDTYSTISTKIDSLYHKVESIAQAAQAKKSNCDECGAEHKTSECPILMQRIKQALWGQRQQYNQYGETFNPNWMKHPNFSWSNQNQNRPHGQFQQQEKRPQLEDMIGKFMEKAKATLQNQNASIKNLETQMGQLAMALTVRMSGNLPNNTEINPKEQVKAITTRSRVQLPEIHVKRPGVTGETFSPTKEETVVKESTPKENSEKS